VTLERDAANQLDHAIDDNERGLKDTVRVNPNEIVEIAVRINSYGGRTCITATSSNTKTAT
jgi:o-aminophenol oxidase